MLLEKYCSYYDTACGYKTMCGLLLYRSTEIIKIDFENNVYVCARCNKKRLRIWGTDYKLEMKSDFHYYIDSLYKLADLPYFEGIVKDEIRIPVRNYDLSPEQVADSSIEYDLVHLTFKEYLKWLREFVK